TLLGTLAGLLAVLAAELVTWLLYRFDLNLEWQPHYLLWLLVPGAGALLIGLAAALGTRAVVNQSPMGLLRRGHRARRPREQLGGASTSPATGCGGVAAL